MIDPLLKIRTHHPQGIDGDLLDHLVYAEVIHQTLIDLNDAHTGLTIGIFGDWGTGKSSVLKMLFEQLNKPSLRQEDDVFQRKNRAQDESQEPQQTKQWIVIKFDAWRYTQYEDLWLALLRKVLDSVNRELTWLEILWVNWQLVRGNLSNIRSVGSLFTSLWQLLRFVLSFFGGNILISLPELPDMLSRSFFGFDRGQSIKVDEFRQDFRIIIESVERPLVVLIDDLDRCPQDQIIPVLEAIKHFGFEEALKSEPLPRYYQNLSLSKLFLSLSQFENSQSPPPLPNPSESSPFSGIVFVLAVDRRAIERAVRIYYKDDQTLNDDQAKLFAREYVEKIIQIPVELLPLHRSELKKLLSSSAAESSPSLPIGEIKKLLDEGITAATDILRQGSKENPRTILQAFNTFQLRWYLVVNRQLEGIDPGLLAGLLLIQYAWPDFFNIIYRNPYNFFYIHALANNIPNEYCTQVEIDELYALGLPQQSPIITYFRDLHSNLIGILRTLKLPKNLDLQEFLTSLTLAKVSLSGDPAADSSRPQSMFEKNATWGDLLSGDPGRIKATALSTPFIESVARLLLSQLSISLNSSNEKIEEIQSQETMNLLFALGRLKLGDFDITIVNSIGNWIINNEKTHSSIIMRAIYTLGHHAVDSHRISSKHAIDQLQKILVEEKLNESIRLRAIQLLSQCSHLGTDDLRMLLSLFREDKMSVVPGSPLFTVAKNSLLTSHWDNNILTALSEDELNFYADDFIFSLCRNNYDKTWPKYFAIYLLQFAAKNEESFNQVVELFRVYDGVSEAMTWLVQCLSLNIDHNQWKSVLNAISDQQSRLIDWYELVWKEIAKIIDNLKNNDLWFLLVETILATRYKNVVDYWLEAYQDYPEHEHAIIRALENSQAEVAEEILDKLESNKRG